MRNLLVVQVLASSFLAGESTVEQIIVRGSHTLGRPWAWLRPLAKRYVQEIAGRTRPRHREVVRFLLHDQGFRQACSRHSNALSVEAWMAEPMRMQPVDAATT